MSSQPSTGPAHQRSDQRSCWEKEEWLRRKSEEQNGAQAKHIGAGWDIEFVPGPDTLFFPHAADTLPRSGEQERKNPMALYILKDKVSRSVKESTWNSRGANDLAIPLQYLQKSPL